MWKLTLTAGLCLIFTCLDISCNGKPAPATTPQSDFCVGKKDGDYAAPNLPNYYYSCVYHIVYVRPCPHNLIFREDLLKCDWPTPPYTSGTGQSQSDTATTTTRPNLTVPEDFCVGKKDGHYAAPNLPNYFYSCVYHEGVVQPCPHNLVFNEKLQICDWPKTKPSFKN